MTNTKLFLLIGTSLSLIPQTINAQCVATQDCATLGYTETSCSGGTGVKCPFGNKWACFKSEEEICQKYGFTLSCSGIGEIGVGKSCNGKYYNCTCDSTYKYTCTGTNQTGGSGKACNGKYSACTCATNYIWNNLSQKCEYDYQKNCPLGALYYSDDTCSQAKLESSKTLLGVVIYEKTTNERGWIMTVKPVAIGVRWGMDGIFTNITDTAINASCTNTQKLAGKGSSYAAANAANNYKPTGTPTGKSWCLPSYDLLNNINDSVNFAKVNTGITIAGGTKLGYGGQPSYDNERVWSSSEKSSDSAWYFNATIGGLFSMDYYFKDSGGTNGSVRPVLAF